MEKLKLVNKYADKFVSDYDIAEISGRAVEAMKTLHARNGEGNDFLGWVTLPTDYDKEEFSRIKKAAEYIKGNCDILIVIGIGGSYLTIMHLQKILRRFILSEIQSVHQW